MELQKGGGLEKDLGLCSPAFLSALSLSFLAPSWLLQDPKSRIRTTDKGFVESVDRYFDLLVPIMVPLQVRPRKCFLNSFTVGREFVLIQPVNRPQPAHIKHEAEIPGFLDSVPSA